MKLHTYFTQVLNFTIQPFSIKLQENEIANAKFLS